MNVIVVLMVFSAVGALLCARARAAGPALVFGVVALLLLVSLPVGDGLPGGFSDFIQWAGDQASTQGGGQ